ncbi:MCE family protein [Mycobacterium sp. CBMA293]|nr:MCE family protein [Mycolicibacterium sp. CBMA 335]MUL70273.1 MCE family protein [Mycolicibacterium sp. CBMA 311]MUL92321.1 MCE family protein [Mycolicibacterium sp. CBMA 230]MUM06742.1 mammalian cell entry protein [Mycolicibacterium sp. CBMA 213]MUM12596.1 MCE family protein [Mycolicibacterium sp. CBMA 293]MUM32310.1 MCE family protein [Mycolicibacterium sp. CBMA 361]
MKVRDGLTFTAFATMVAIAIWYIGSLGVRVGPPDNRANVSMKVADINGLVVDSNVLLRGVPVGKVTGINSAGGAATIDFYIDGRYHVPVDSEVRLENLSALGESYIGLLPQSQNGPMMHDGLRIVGERVIQPSSISELATSVVRVLNQADAGALERVVQEVDTALPNPVSVLPNLSHASNVLRSVVADMNGRGRVLLDNFQTLLQNAGWVGPLLADLAPQIQALGANGGLTFSAFQTIQAQGGPHIFLQFNRFLDRLQKLLDDNGGDLNTVGTAMLPHLKGLGGSLMNFDTGQILSNILATIPPDGTVTLHVAVPPTR